MSGRAWAQREKQVLTDQYPEKCAAKLASMLDRSKASIYVKASKMGIRSRRSGVGRRWAPDEIEILRRNYPTKKVSKLARMLDRTEKSVKNKIESMNLRKSRKISKFEISRIRELSSKNESLETIAKEVGVSPNVARKIICHPGRLGRLYSKGFTQKEIAGQVGASQSFISELMKKHGIKTKASKLWSKAEEEMLKKYYLRVSKGELITLLPRRTWESIKRKASKLGLSRSIEEYRHSGEVLARLMFLSRAQMIELNWDKKMDISYVLGVLDGDGYTDKKHTIGLETKSFEFAKKFKEKLKDWGMHSNMGLRKGRNHWVVWACSKEFVEWYTNLSTNKKLEWLLRNEGAWEYIEGRYDSDGYLHPSGCPLICSRKSKERMFILELLSRLGMKATIQEANGVWIRATSVRRFFKNVCSIYPHKNLAQVTMLESPADMLLGLPLLSGDEYA